MVTFAIQSDGEWLEELGQARCGEDVVMRGFREGAYTLETLISSRPAATRVRGIAPFQIVNRNIDLPILLSNGEDVNGKVNSV